MVIYKLEDDPNTYISPSHYGNRFVYRMANFVNESYTRRVIRNIDLRNDKLMIHGTEIKEAVLRRLYECLTLGVGPKMGHIYVNCNGACYFFVTGKGICRPINNTIFDWSLFQVIVPNSLNYSLRKELKQKEVEVEVEQSNNVQLCLAKDEALSAKASLEVTTKNMKKLEDQLSICRKENEDMSIEVKKLQDELKSTKKMLLDSSQKKVNEVKEYQFFGPSNKEKDHQNMKEELFDKVSEQLHSVSSKVKFTNHKLDQAILSKLWTPKSRDDLPAFIDIEEVDE